MPKKATNIYKRKDGRWEARFLKSINADGKRIYGSVYGITFDEAKAKQEKQFIIQKINDISDKNDCIKLSIVSLEWLNSIRLSTKVSTRNKYETIVYKHIKSHSIADRNVRLIDTKQINEFTEYLSNQGLASKTINDILVVIGLILKFAEEMYGIIKPKIHYLRQEKREIRVLSIHEQAILEQFLYKDTNYYKLGVLLALYTGIRIGELCALQWEDIDVDKITINKTVQRISNGNKTELRILTSKTHSSIRTIPLPTFFNEYINSFRETGAVVKNRNHMPVEPRLMQLTFKKYIEECGMPKTNFHALRHTFATRCVESGFDIKSLSEILGHSDVKTTLNRYVHSSMAQKQKNMELLMPIVKV